jgi:DNA repair exonuclease SbcCD ATPase subunit
VDTEEQLQDSEELLNEVKGPEEQLEDEYIEEEEYEEEAEETAEEVEYEESEEEEVEVEVEELTGAKFRHKLKAEKEAREKIEKEAQELKERLARLEGRAEAQYQPAPEPEQPVEEVPDPEIEPERYAIYKANKLEEQLKQMEQQQVRLNAERQWDAMQTEHAKANPSYNDAKSFLLEKEAQKIRTMYPTASESEISQHLKEQEYITAGNAARAGMDPLQHIEFLAFQAGFRPSEAEVKKEAPKKKPNIKAIKKNVKKNASLIGGSAAGNNGDVKSAEQLLNMSIDQIHKMGVDKYEAAVKKIHARASS